MAESNQERSKRELSVAELEAEQITALHEREALGVFGVNISTVVGVNVPIALNILSDQSSATAIGGQFIGVGQSWGVGQNWPTTSLIGPHQI
jgi:hypothetical protein